MRKYMGLVLLLVVLSCGKATKKEVILNSLRPSIQENDILKYHLSTNVTSNIEYQKEPLPTQTTNIEMDVEIVISELKKSNIKGIGRIKKVEGNVHSMGKFQSIPGLDTLIGKEYPFTTTPSGLEKTEEEGKQIAGLLFPFYTFPNEPTRSGTSWQAEWDGDNYIFNFLGIAGENAIIEYKYEGPDTISRPTPMGEMKMTMQSQTKGKIIFNPKEKRVVEIKATISQEGIGVVNKEELEIYNDIIITIKEVQ